MLLQSSLSIHSTLLFPSLPFLQLLPATTNFEIFLFEVAFLHSFFVRDHTDNNNNLYYFIYLYIGLLFSHLPVPKSYNFIFIRPSLSTHSTLLIPLSVIPVVTSCIIEFRGLPLLRLSEHHSKSFVWIISLSILCTWPYQFNCLYLIYSKIIIIN